MISIWYLNIYLFSGISLEGDEELLAVPKQPEAPPTRDEWMTTLPPERKVND
jgi:hypothetical protein